jgi:hypothetical protein
LKSTNLTVAKHGVAILFREGTKSEEVALNSRLNAIAIRVELGKRRRYVLSTCHRRKTNVQGFAASIARELLRFFIFTEDLTIHRRSDKNAKQRRAKLYE